MDLEHPSISMVNRTGYPERIPFTVCANEKCEQPIYHGQRVWKKGKDLFCHSQCLRESFTQEDED